LDLGDNEIGPVGARALADSPFAEGLTRLDLSGNPIGDRGVKALAASTRLVRLGRLELRRCAITRLGAKALLSSPHLDRLLLLWLENNTIGRTAFKELRARLGVPFLHEYGDDLTPEEIVSRVKEEPPRCLRGFAARTDTDLLRRFLGNCIDEQDHPSVTFELAHPDPEQRAVLLGYEDTRARDIFLSPYAIRWEPSGEQREFFDGQQHGTIRASVGTGKRSPWRCGRRGCHDHNFLVTFFYRLESPPRVLCDPYRGFGDQFFSINVDAFCASQDKVISVAGF
jgi:hypothetical protein